MTTSDDKALEAALARVLGPEAEDTAPLSRAVLTRIAGQAPPRRAHLAEVLTMPLPATGLVLGLLLIAGALGYAVSSGIAEETMLMQILIGAGL
jgi:hypothetical protein